LSLGTLVGQAAVFLVSPILSRLYGPDEIGIYGTYATWLGLGFIVASLRYDACIPLVETDREAFQIAWVCLCVTAILAGAVAVLGVTGDVIARSWFGISGMKYLLCWIGGGILAGGVFQITGAICVRKQQFKGLATARSGMGIILATSQVSLGLAGFRSIGLLLSDVLSRAFTIVPTVWSLRSEYAGALHGLTASKMVALLRRFWYFPAYVLPSALMNIMSTQALLLWGPKLFSLSETGAFFLAYRSLFLPGSLVAQAVSQVFLGRIAATTENNERTRSTFAVLLVLLAVGTPIYLGVFHHALYLFPFVFGPEWDLAGAYAFLMAPHLLLWLPATATSSILLVNRKFSQSLLINLAHLCLTLGGLYWGFTRNSYFEAVGVLSVLSIVLYGFGICWFASLEKVPLSNLLAAYIRSSLAWNLPFLLLQLLVAQISVAAAAALWLVLLPLVVLLSVRSARSETEAGPLAKADSNHD
jgi:lipopolysaccharide exporter